MEAVLPGMVYFFRREPALGSDDGENASGRRGLGLYDVLDGHRTFFIKNQLQVGLVSLGNHLFIGARRDDGEGQVPKALLLGLYGDFVPSLHPMFQAVLVGGGHGSFGKKRMPCMHAELGELANQGIHFLVFQKCLGHVDRHLVIIGFCQGAMDNFHRDFRGRQGCNPCRIFIALGVKKTDLVTRFHAENVSDVVGVFPLYEGLGLMNEVFFNKKST